MNKEEFYNKCALLLGVEQDYVNIPQFGRTGRWGPRAPGNGRFEGFGVIRFYGPTMIHVMRANKTITFKTPEEVFAYIASQ